MTIRNLHNQVPKYTFDVLPGNSINKWLAVITTARGKQITCVIDNIDMTHVHLYSIQSLTAHNCDILLFDSYVHDWYNKKCYIPLSIHISKSGLTNQFGVGYQSIDITEIKQITGLLSYFQMNKYKLIGKTKMSRPTVTAINPKPVKVCRKLSIKQKLDTKPKGDVPLVEILMSSNKSNTGQTRASRIYITYCGVTKSPRQWSAALRKTPNYVSSIAGKHYYGDYSKALLWAIEKNKQIDITKIIWDLIK